MLEFSSWPLPSIDQNTAVWLHILLSFAGAFLASYMIYGWLDKTGRQSAGFSPTVASILTTPILAASYGILITKDFSRGSFGNELTRMLFELFFLGPIFLVLPPLLAIYLRGGFLRIRMAGMMLGAATLICLLLQGLWLDYLLDHS